MCFHRICCGRNLRSVSFSMSMHVLNARQLQLSTKFQPPLPQNIHTLFFFPTQLNQVCSFPIFFTGLKTPSQRTTLFYISQEVILSPVLQRIWVSHIYVRIPHSGMYTHIIYYKSIWLQLDSCQGFNPSTNSWMWHSQSKFDF